MVSQLWRSGVLKISVRTSFKFFSAAALTSVMAGCAQAPRQQIASGGIDPKYGVSPSPRVVADGEPVPKGGGNYIVGKPYVIAGKTYYPSERASSTIGSASWYGADFHGRKTANGEIFDRQSITAAHPTMPLPSYARVTNLKNSYSMIVRVNDRGPYHGGRVMDVSQRVAEALDFKRHGTAKVRIEYMGRAQMSGSDDQKLMASLQTDGTPATLDGISRDAPVMVAQKPEKARLASIQPSQRNALASQVDDAADQADGEEGRVAASFAAHTPLRDSTHDAAGKLASLAPIPPNRPFDLGGSRAK